MTDSEFPPPHSHAGRRRIATTDQRLRRRCPLADATSIGFAIVRRPASARPDQRPSAVGALTATTVYSESII
jgi:hypothetical protein